MQTSMFSAEEPPANPSPSPDSERDWMIRVATSCLPMEQLLLDIGPAGWSGRTSPECFQAERDETLRLFWASSREKQLPPPHQAGENADLSRGSLTPTESPGGFSMRNISEWPSAAAVCSLSDILEIGGLPQRYFLSATACKGILRRAEKRGRQLSTTLAQALAQAAGVSPGLEKPVDKTQ